MRKEHNDLIFRLTDKELIEGTFLRRLNRFVVECLIEGEKHLAHLPNPGRLWELLFRGSKILLYKDKSPGRNLNFTVAAVYRNSKPILLHTTKTNDVAEWMIRNRLIKEIREYELIAKERQFNNSRIDFFLSNGKQELFLEVKSCTLFQNKISMFPDAVTDRGRKHLIELAKLRSNNTRGGILFLVHNYDVDYFLPEYHTDLKFAQNFYNYRNEIEFFVYSLKWNDDLTLPKNHIKPVKIPFKILEEEVDDAGTYLIIMHNDRDQKIGVGNLGLIHFKKGFYCYVGSALQNLSKRIDRHKRKIKKMHWHIDYLSNKTKIIKTIEIRSPERLECEVSNSLSKLAITSIKKFGSSDCSCNSHLFYFKENPIQQKDFIDLILYFRMERLINKYLL